MLTNAFNNHVNKDANLLKTSMLEFIEQIQFMSDVYNHIERISIATKDLITDSSKYGNYKYKTYTGQFIGNMVKAAVSNYLSAEQHDGMFKDITICNAGAAMLAMQLKKVKNVLENASNENEIAAAFNGFTQILQHYLIYYTGVVGTSTKLHEQFEALHSSLKSAMDDLAKEKCQQTLGGLRGLASLPFQHLMRIPLLLKATTDYASKCDPVLFKDSAESLLAVIQENEELVQHVNENATAIKPYN